MHKHGLKLLCALLLAAAGCDSGSMGYILSRLAPRPKAKTVPAEYASLPGHRVAVVVHTEPAMEYEYPGVRVGLASMITSQFRANVKGAAVVDAREVAQYQDENLRWDEMDRGELGRKLQCDYLLYISLVEYSMREPGSVGLFRGRITAEVSVFDSAQPERNGRVWRGKDITVVYPPGGSPNNLSEDGRTVRRKAEDMFVDIVVKNFYSHKVQPEEE